MANFILKFHIYPLKMSFPLQIYSGFFPGVSFYRHWEGLTFQEIQNNITLLYTTGGLTLFLQKTTTLV